MGLDNKYIHHAAELIRKFRQLVQPSVQEGVAIGTHLAAEKATEKKQKPDAVYANSRDNANSIFISNAGEDEKTKKTYRK